LEAKGIAYGTREISGSLTAYFSDEALYNAFKNGLYTWLMFDLSDGTHSYRVFFPRVKFDSGQTNAGDNNSDVESSLEWKAILSQDFNSAVIISAIDDISSNSIDIIRTSGVGTGFGRFAKTAELINAKNVYLSHDGVNALWNDGANWNVTTAADKVGESATNAYQTTSDVEAAAVADTEWAGTGTFTGTDVRSDLFDPTVAVTQTSDFVVIENDA
jgi:hypothetical protein